MTDPAPTDDDLSWFRRELAGDGSGRVLTTVARGIGLLGSTALAVLVFGVLAAVLAVAAFMDRPPLLVVALAACIPAVVAPAVAWRSLGRLRDSVSHPAEVRRQARDLLSGMSDTSDLRELAGRLRRRRGGPRRPGGRIRRAVGTGRLISAVIGRAGPDEDRHPLLVPFTPEHTARLWFSLTWSAWGLLLAFLVATVAVLALAASAV